MPTIAPLYLYEGNYREEYNHLNRAHFIGRVKILTPKVTYEEARCSLDDTTIYTTNIRLPRSMASISTDDLRSALRSYWHQGCTCQHDCCGHLFGGLTRMKRNKRNVWIQASYQRNF